MDSGNGFSTAVYVVMPILMLVIFYFVLIRPQKKREKEMNSLRNSLQIGDVVVTVGGIVGIVTSVKEDALVLETGSDRNKVRIKKWAVQSVESVEKNRQK